MAALASAMLPVALIRFLMSPPALSPRTALPRWKRSASSLLKADAAPAASFLFFPSRPCPCPCPCPLHMRRMLLLTMRRMDGGSALQMRRILSFLVFPPFLGGTPVALSLVPGVKSLLTDELDDRVGHRCI